METINDVIEFIIKNSNNTEMMDRINKITFPFTSKYNSRFNQNADIRIWGNWHRHSYEELKEIVEAPLWTFPGDALLTNSEIKWGEL